MSSIEVTSKYGWTYTIMVQHIVVVLHQRNETSCSIVVSTDDIYDVEQCYSDVIAMIKAAKDLL